MLYENMRRKNERYIRKAERGDDLKKLLKKAAVYMVIAAMVFTVSVPSADAAGTMSTASVKGISAVSQNYNTIKISWKKVINAKGYQVYCASSRTGKYSRKATLSGAARTSYLHSSLTAGKKYYYKVRAYGTKNGKTVYSRFSAVAGTYPKPSKPVSLKFTPAAAMKGYCSIDWPSVKGASGYQLEIRRKGSSSWQTSTYVGGKSYKVKLNGSSASVYLDNAQDYQVRARAYRTVGKSRVYSLYSDIRTIASSLPDFIQREVYNNGGIRIVMKGMEYRNTVRGPEIGLDIENGSSRNVMVQVRDMSVNGIVVNPVMSAAVLKGKKVSDSISLNASELEACGIKLIKDIEFRFAIINADNFMEIDESGIIGVSTDAKDYEQTYDRSGHLIVNEQGVKIYFAGYRLEQLYREPFRIFVENSSGRDITVQLDNTSVNSYMMTPLISCNVPAGRKSYDMISFIQSDFEKNGIKKIEKMETVFCVSEEGSGRTITRQPVAVNVNW